MEKLLKHFMSLKFMLEELLDIKIEICKLFKKQYLKFIDIKYKMK